MYRGSASGEAQLGGATNYPMNFQARAYYVISVERLEQKRGLRLRLVWGSSGIGVQLVFFAYDGRQGSFPKWGTPT